MPRHIGLLASFTLVVILPMLVSAWYLWSRAADQYASTVGFSVHREGSSPALSLISGLSSLSGSSSADTDIIYNFLSSQQLVTEIDSELGLREIWSRPQGDPLFTFDPTLPVEDLLDYWNSMVSIYYDSTTRLIEVRTLAFTPEDAHAINEAIYKKSTLMINRLNDIAAEDTVRYARSDLEKAREDLEVARAEMTAFRNKHQLIDPAAELAAQGQILASLQQELAQSMIELDMVRETSIATDPRIAATERRIRVIEERIRLQREKLDVGESGSSDDAYVSIVAEYESLAADRLFAENAYQAARVAYEVARAEASRQSRYLAAHIAPTMAEASRFPERWTMLALVTVFLGMIWAVGALVFYSLRDRR